MYCDVALPVPIDSTFTYQVDGEPPVIGGRVLVPFREQRLPGVVVALHDQPPAVQARLVLRVLDQAPLLNETLLRLARWISQYYIAPFGEVVRTMLPLHAEWRHAWGYRATESGLEALHQAATVGSSRRLRSSAEEQATEYEVLDYLAQRAGECVREATLRSATSASRSLLQTLVRRKWIAREDLSEVRNAARVVKFAARKANLREEPFAKPSRPLNANQQSILAALDAAGGRVSVSDLGKLPVPATTLLTLIKRGLVEIQEQPAEFSVSRARVRPPLDFDLTAAQQVALQHVERSVQARRFSVALMHGVTGSGKTAVYLSAMQKLLAQDRGAIMLVPEIGLTPAAAAQLHHVFGEAVAILHSALTDSERAEQWRRIQRGDARIAVGTRSAVFAPVKDLALIVVDEEHDGSYKQEETPRYHGRDVAVMRAKLTGAAVVLGSATPSLESYYNTRQGKYALIELPDRVEKRPLPRVQVVDMRREFQETGRQQVISRRLAEEIAARLQRGEQAMVLLNRRGFSAFVMCRACGQVLQCRNCAIAMTYHKIGRRDPLDLGDKMDSVDDRFATPAPMPPSSPAIFNQSTMSSPSRRPVLSPKPQGRMHCHYCGYQQRTPQACPECGSDYVQFLGAGSEKLEEILHAQFPQARIGRLDRDTVRDRADIERTLNAMEAGELDLLVGTQMIAKGHDLHKVTLVGVVAADAALAFPDFRAAERTFQLLTQVAGRAGRGDSPGEVILQTYFPEHYAVQYAAHHDFSGFYEKELRYRSWMRYPPFAALANVLVRSDRLEEVLKYSGILGKWFRDTRHEGIRVLGPAAAPLARLKNEYRYHLLLKSASREKLNAALRAMLAHAGTEKIPRTNIVVDVDPVSLM